jgi:multidrug efflux pump subunit AcrB
VSLAYESVRQGADPIRAALDAGVNRLRPVAMTALALGIGMLPISLGLGTSGECFAPLGRAVLGGLVAGVGATLVLAPVLFVVALPRIPKGFQSFSPGLARPARTLGN